MNLGEKKWWLQVVLQPKFFLAVVPTAKLIAAILLAVNVGCSSTNPTSKLGLVLILGI